MTILSHKYDIRWFLEQWSQWARGNPDLALGYPDATPVSQFLEATVASSYISDEQVLAVDAMVARLQRRHPEMGEAVTLFFLFNCNTYKVAVEMELYHSEADFLVKSGLVWLDAALDCS